MNSRQSKFLAWINYRVRVIIQDARMLVGTLLAFDKHMNLVLADTEEYTRVKAKKEGELDKERKRTLGLIILRGENIVSFSAESPPSQNTEVFETKKETEGKSITIGRGNIVDSMQQQKINPIQNPMAMGMFMGRGMPMMNPMMMQGMVRPPNMMNNVGVVRPPMNPNMLAQMNGKMGMNMNPQMQPQFQQQQQQQQQQPNQNQP
jgi:small nuclear ribonucleoprotein B and B'